MKRIDIISKICNFILTAVYLPLSFFSGLLPMASESTIGANNPVYIALVDAFSTIAFIIPFLCITGIVLSVIFRRKGKYVISLIVQFIPLIVFLLNFVLLAVADAFPRVI